MRGTVDAQQRRLVHRGVALGGGKARVAQQVLHGAQVGAAGQQVGGETVPQRVRRRIVRQAHRQAPGAHRLLHDGGVQPPAAGAEITVAEAAARRDAGAFILDVREPEEWDEYHIPGATLIPLGDLEARLAEVPSDQPIVVVCRSGNRSQQGRDILTTAGYSDVASMAGGLKEWRSQGYPTVTGP